VEGLIEISEKEFRDLSDLVYRTVGIHLTNKKKMLVRGRLNKVIKRLGYTSFDEYYRALESDSSGRNISELIDRISTNHTYFFREKDHFTIFQELAIPWIEERLERRGNRDIRIWCAGCASGEEAYTIAMILAEQFGTDYFSGGAPILATDVSSTALDAALTGTYPLERLKEVPKPMLHKYFNSLGGDRYQVKDTLKKLVLYKRLNFSSERFPFKGKFQTIFCRNVMIYFDPPTKDRLISKFEQYIEDDGFFFIGHSETLGRNHPAFRYLKPAAYRKGGLHGPV
jgi:chemotaxis protein methyltransferase CheR